MSTTGNVVNFRRGLDPCTGPLPELAVARSPQNLDSATAGEPACTQAAAGLRVLPRSKPVEDPNIPASPAQRSQKTLAVRRQAEGVHVDLGTQVGNQPCPLGRNVECLNQEMAGLICPNRIEGAAILGEALELLPFTVVHELIHLEMAPILSDLPRTDANRLEEEHAVNQMAEALRSEEHTSELQ